MCVYKVVGEQFYYRCEFCDKGYHVHGTGMGRTTPRDEHRASHCVVWV